MRKVTVKRRKVLVSLISLGFMVAGGVWVLRSTSVHADAINNTDFVITVKSDNTGSSGTNQFTIPTTGTGYNYTVDCDNDGNPEATGQTGDYTCTFGAPGTHTIRIGGTFPRIYFNNTGDKLKLISVDQWGTGTWSSMIRAFYGAANMDVKATDTPKFASSNMVIQQMFQGATNLVGAGANWNWNTESVVNMYSLFNGATKFNQNIGSWNTSNVTSMTMMFDGAIAFNNGDSSSIKDWNTSKVVSLQNTFKGARAFNQPLDWNVGAVTNMANMFNGARSFNRSLAGWDISKVTQLTDMLNSTALSVANYDATLIAWQQQNVKTNVTLGATGLKYCQSEAARTSLINDAQWTINGDSKDPACMPPATPLVAPDMTAATDSGDSDSDNITNNTAPSFIAKCTANNTTIKLYLDNVQSATASCTGAGDITIPLATPLADNTYHLAYTESNAYGESAKSPVLNFTIDTTPPAAPQITIEPISNDDTISQSEATQPQAVTGQITGAKDGDVVTLVINGAQRQVALVGDRFGFAVPGADLANNPEKKVTVSVITKDIAGNPAAASRERPYTVDTASLPAPAAPMLTPASDTGRSNSDNITNDTTPTVVLTCQNATDKLHIYINSFPFSDVQCTQAGPIEVTLSTLGQGQRRLTYTIENGAGNTSAPSAELPLAIDTTAPQADIETSGTFTAIPEIKGGTNDADAAVVVTINGVDYPAANVAGDWTVPATALAALTSGTYNFTVTLTDIAGNATTLNGSFTLNLPTPPNTSTPGSNNSAQSTPGNLAGSESSKKSADLAETGMSFWLAMIAGIAMIVGGAVVVKKRLLRN